MKYLETKHERNSAKITALIVVILLLLLFVVGPPYLDPPEEYGVAVNFGSTDFGSGNVQPKAPLKPAPSKPVEEIKKVDPEPVKAQPAAAEPKKENVLTEDNEEAIAIKKQKAAAEAKAREEARAKAEAERIEREKREAEERKRREEEAKKKRLDDLIGGVSNSSGTASGGEGPDNKAGDKGQLDGDPYAPSYFGGSGPGKGGVGYGLNGRGRPTHSIFKQDCNEYGLVVVKIEVDRSGRVVAAEPGVRGTTNTAPCLLEPARKIALSHKWPADNNAPARQIGFVSINFSISQ
ncbi:energy transducer TonB [Aegicerativicinus sediminis]|uniref:energy transducer TonB n=1 Tax=Aegicerativicinus sediminis TaxID=2893202 RepID=UPI001E2AAACE|nr:energy transducer TonB [Aegicerativicinus sediminis]